MGIWHLWTTWLANALSFFSSHLGLSEAAAIILLTLLARLALMPISLTASLRSERNKQKLEALKPELERLKERHKDDSAKMATETMRLYRENKIRFMDRMSIMNIGLQSVFGLGFFHVLRKMGSASRFLWIGSIAKPDVALTVIIGVLMLLGSALMPGLRLEPSTILMILLPAVLGIIAVATLPSAVGLYWAASNGFTVLQTLALRGLLRRRV